MSEISGKILVVDDDASIRLLVSDVLTDQGLAVVTVPSGEEEALPVPDDVLEGQVAFGELELAGDDA